MLMIASGFIVSRLHKPLATVHPIVELAEEIHYEIQTNKHTESEESKAFHASGIPVEQLFTDAAEIQSQFFTGTWIIGIFLGLFFGIGLIKSSTARPVVDYVPHKGNCVSCGRCYKSCPVGKEIQPLND